MNVTKANFAEAAAELERLLPSAAFVAIDEEMTGITLPGQPERIEDVPASRYPKMRKVASQYSIVQFGVCLFHADESAPNRYVARPYNFYTFPEAGAVNMEASSIAFLREHKMDFNKWINEGIPYVSRIDAERLRTSLFPKLDANVGGTPRGPMVLSKKDDVEVTEKALAALDEWLNDKSKNEETEYEVMTTNPYLRRYLYEAVASRFPTLTAESRPLPNVRGLSAFVTLRLTETQKQERDAKKRAEKEKEYNAKVGFSRVFRALAEAKRPMVGHNCFYDLLFMMSHFEGPLPNSYASFKDLFGRLFPLVFDTKLLAAREPFKWVPGSNEQEGRFGSTALGEVYGVFKKEAESAMAVDGIVEVSFAPGFERYVGDAGAAAHEAAYDAYMTGYAFAFMAKEALSAELAPKLRNRTPMFRSFYDFNLGGEDTKLNDGVHVHCSGLKGLAVSDVQKAFADIKAPNSVDGSQDAVKLNIRWIDDSSAFVILPTACASAVVAMLEKCRSLGAINFTPEDEWFASRTAAADKEASEGDGAAMKRARTS